MDDSKDTKPENKLVDLLALIDFQIESIVELLLEKEIISRQEFIDKIYSKIDRGEDEESKVRLREKIERNY